MFVVMMLSQEMIDLGMLPGCKPSGDLRIKGTLMIFALQKRLLSGWIQVQITVMTHAMQYLCSILHIICNCSHMIYVVYPDALGLAGLAKETVS